MERRNEQTIEEAYILNEVYHRILALLKQHRERPELI